MILMYGMKFEDVKTEFLNKEFVKRHEELWEQMKKKYQFVDKSLDLSEAVFYTKPPEPPERRSSPAPPRITSSPPPPQR